MVVRNQKIENEELSELLLSYKTGKISLLLDEVFDCNPYRCCRSVGGVSTDFPAGRKVAGWFQKRTSVYFRRENHILDGIIVTVKEENLDVYVGNNSGGINTEIIAKLGELGIEVNEGAVYRMLENPVMPVKEDFAENPTEYEQAQSEFRMGTLCRECLKTVLPAR